MSDGPGGRKLGPPAGVPPAETMSAPHDEQPPAQAPRPGAVLDPAWEEALRRGQVADGGAGSVDAELAVVHLLRHARAPEGLEPAAEEAAWRDVKAAITPTPWWRRRWLWAGLAPAAAAAVVVLAVRLGDQGGTREAAAPRVARAPAASAPAVEAEAAAARGRRAAAAEEAPAAEAVAPGGLGRSPTARTLEQQFATLAPPARARLADDVDRARARTRAHLLDAVTETPGGGGAP